MHILITGGAGFIGSHVADQLIEEGHRVRALDCLVPQVHTHGGSRPDYLHPDVELIVGDMRDEDVVRAALQGIDAVLHLAAAVGVGQSMYQVVDYTSTNNIGTAVLMEALIERPVQRLVVASSMSIYGEGAYRRADGTTAAARPRDPQRIRRGDFEAYSADAELLEPIPTPEEKIAEPSSVYALSKYDQERMSLIVGAAYNIPTVALRFFNAYGPRQALSNPYTGVLAIFASRYLNGKAPLIFEDGYQRRDFVSVHDVARACSLALQHPEAVGEVFNVGSGEATTVREVASQLAQTLARTDIEPEVTNKYRAGDIRHCFADITKARHLLGYEPRVSLFEGLVELAQWLEGQMAEDRAEQAQKELSTRGLTV